MDSILTRPGRMLALCGVIGACTLLAGCGSYYMVRDPSSGTSYYTTDLDHESGGAVKFTDDASGDKVTLQSSEVTEISKKEYKRNVKQ